MEVVQWDTAVAPPQSCVGNVVAVGNFDGVHQGHRALLRRLTRLRQRLGTRSMVMTFDPPPQVLLRPDTPLLRLTTLPQRLQLLERFGVDVVLIFVTTSQFLSYSSEQFLDDLLGRQLQVQGMVEGKNFHFGKDRTGDVRRLIDWCQRRHIPLEIVDDVYRQGLRISSSEIRALLATGDVRRARRALGRPYSITGQVMHGDERGRKIGFPTANLDQIQTLIPAVGVYACVAVVRNQPYPAAVNVGPNPTFGVTQGKVEAHLLEFTGDLYGADLTLKFLEKLRDTRPFPSLPALQDQLARDVQATRQIASDYLERSKREHPC